MLNTHVIVKKMTAAGMPVQQAEAVADLMVETVTETLASKRDLVEVRNDLQADIATLRKDVQTDIATLRKDVQSDIATLRRDMETGDANIRRDVKDVETKLVARMDTQIELVEKLFERSQRQTLQVGLGIALAIIAVLGFLFRFLAK